MFRFIFISILIVGPCLALEKPTIYDPTANAQAQIDEAVTRAARDGKHVLIQIGGNWCSWCIKLEGLYKADAKVGDAIKKNYEFVHVNFSPENENLKVLARLGNPQRFGFPVILVLDGKGKRLHTQDSGYLEKGKQHDPGKVLRFLELWAPGADKTK